MKRCSNKIKQLFSDKNVNSCSRADCNLLSKFSAQSFTKKFLKKSLSVLFLLTSSSGGKVPLVAVQLQQSDVLLKWIWDNWPSEKIKFRFQCLSWMPQNLMTGYIFELKLQSFFNFSVEKVLLRLFTSFIENPFLMKL